MRNPLTKSQEALRGRKRADMTTAQLHEWIDACNKMEAWVKPAKARRTWKLAREDALTEIAKRAARQSPLEP
jgi:hypothetical protein